MAVSSLIKHNDIVCRLSHNEKSLSEGQRSRRSRRLGNGFEATPTQCELILKFAARGADGSRLNSCRTDGLIIGGRERGRERGRFFGFKRRLATAFPSSHTLLSHQGKGYRTAACEARISSDQPFFLGEGSMRAVVTKSRCTSQRNLQTPRNPKII